LDFVHEAGIVTYGRLKKFEYFYFTNIKKHNRKSGNVKKHRYREPKH